MSKQNESHKLASSSTFANTQWRHAKHLFRIFKLQFTLVQVIINVSSDCDVKFAFGLGFSNG